MEELDISFCVSCIVVSILVNGIPTRQFKMYRELRQGCSVSPFLFNLVVEDFGILMYKAVDLRLFRGAVIGRNGFIVTHLQYVDDTLVLCKPDFKDLTKIKRVLRCFGAVAGPKINFQKSVLYGIGVD